MKWSQPLFTYISSIGVEFNQNAVPFVANIMTIAPAKYLLYISKGPFTYYVAPGRE